VIFSSELGEPEGPVALPDGSWLVVEMAPERGCVSHVAPDGSVRRILQTGRPNGLAVDGDGRIWVAESQQRALLVVSRSGEVQAEISGPADTPFLFPNDVAFGPDGALYLTDSGIHTADFFADGDIRANYAALRYDGRVYRVDPADGTVATLDTGIRFTNGLAFDARGDLFVNETMTGMIFRYRLSQGSSARENFANVLDPSVPTRYRGPDGMAFDVEGRLYCTVYGQGDVTVVEPDGTVSRRIPTAGSRPTNVAFGPNGESRIYVTEVGRGALEMYDVSAPGLPLHAPAVARPGRADPSS
jgi:gluconolactonase